METGTIDAPAAAGSSPAPAAAQPDLPGVGSGGSAPEPTPAPAAAPDPFEVDEASLAALSPESRTAVEPMLKAWKEKASSTLQKETATKAELEKQAKVLENLTKNPQFQQWYRSLTSPQPQSQPAAPEPKGPAHVSPEEWVAAANDPVKFSELQKRQAQAVLEEKLGKEMEELRKFRYETQLENQFRTAKEKYKDLNDKEYDNPDVHLLEPLVWYWADFKGKEGGTVEQAFGHLKKIETYFEKKFQAKYNQMVQQKKAGSTEPPAPSAAGSPDTVYAKGKDAVLRETIRAALSGRNVDVVSRK